MSQPSLLVVPSQIGQGKLFAYSPLVGAPVEFGVTRATTAIRTNASGLLASVASGIARIDYGVTGCPTLLVEPAATNLLLRSEEFDNASWVKNATGINTAIGTNGIEANVAVAPNGASTADRVNFNVQADSDLGLTQVFGGTVVGTTYISSIYIKGEGANIGRQVRVRIRRESGGTFVGGTTTYTLTSDWVRVLTPSATLVSGNVGVQLVLSSNDATSALIWGAQLGTGSVATSYIPTISTTQTRNADVISLASGSSYIGQTSGAIAGRFFAARNAGHIAMLSDGTSNNSIQIDYGNAASGVLRATVFTAGVPHTLVESGALASGFHSFCFTYESGNFALYVDGALAEADTAAFLPSGLARIDIGSSLGASSWFNGRIARFALYKEIPNNPATISTL